MNLSDLPREPRVGDSIRYDDGLVRVEHQIAGVNYEGDEAVKLWIQRSETDERGVLSGLQDSWIDRATLEKWLAKRGVSCLIQFGE